ncbi:MAG: FkbM family methyltransferase, partial [Candidatus Acidiferrales bacterium]
FEPDPENVAVCEENINKNNFIQASVVAAAVWGSNGQMSFERGEDGPSRMSGRVIQENSAAGQPKQMVTCPAVTLDDFCKSHRPPTFLMIDAEGGEFEVLRGARATLEQFRPDLLIEVHSPESLPAVRASLEPFGYQVRPVAMHPDKLHVYCTRGS